MYLDRDGGGKRRGRKEREGGKRGGEEEVSLYFTS